MPCHQVTQEDIYALIRKRIWTAFITAGSITATVSYWISQLPVWQRTEMIQKLNDFLMLPK